MRFSDPAAKLYDACAWPVDLKRADGRRELHRDVPAGLSRQDRHLRNVTKEEAS
jgi:hypothetical protein